MCHKEGSGDTSSRMHAINCIPSTMHIHTASSKDDIDLICMCYNYNNNYVDFVWPRPIVTVVF
jgi:hypothetical protein